MLIRPNDSTRHRARRALAAAWAALALAACGGGGSDAGSTSAAPSATATSYAAGPITGFGSVIVRGVRFDDANAQVSDDDGVSHRSGDLRLGMMAEVESAGITSDSLGSHGLAKSIRFGSEIVGPVSAVAADGSSLVVLGETVQIDTATLFDDRLVGGLAAITVGTVIEVHGVLNVTSGIYTATRIEPKPNAPFFKLRGVVSNIDKTAHTLRIGSGTDTISYDSIAANVPSTLDNGRLVRVRLQTAQVGGQWVAATIVSAVRKLGDHDEVELEGTITDSSFDTDKKFSVNGIAVDASGATFPKGSTGIVLGARVEVKGSAVNGVVVATRVTIETEHEFEAAGFELHGAISALDTTAKTFALRGITVNYGGSSVEFRNGTVADLANDKKVEVKGLRSSDGTTLNATRVSFEN
jgi:hypothetical protein